MSKSEETWNANYEALKTYILERGHLPDKHVVTNRSLLSWAKYQRKKAKKERWIARSENCSNHYSPLVQPSIQGEEERFDKTDI